MEQIPSSDPSLYLLGKLLPSALQFFFFNFFFSFLNPQRQRDLEAQTCPATFLSNLVLINPRREVGFS